jgi:hypothetical protein
VFDPDAWAYLPLEPMQTTEIPKNVGGKVSVTRASFFLQCLSPMRNGCVYYVAT